MSLRPFLRLALLALPFSVAFAETALADASSPLWLRHPALSPDGKRIAFTYGGQIWVGPATGGEAVALTPSDLYATRPVWAPDGKAIALAAKRHGNLDVYLLPLHSRELQRLTHHSADDVPFAFSPRGDEIYFSSSRLHSPRSIHAGTYAQSEQLYTVPTRGGRTHLVVPTPALDVAPSADGKRLLYEDRPVPENHFRKGAVSDAAHDLWLFDLTSGTHRRLTSFRGEDRTPVWAPDQQHYYYLSEQSGTANIWRAALDAPTEPVAITHHQGDAVRSLSIATDGSLAYAYAGELWHLGPGGTEPRKIELSLHPVTFADERITADGREHLSELSVTADGKQVAIIARGEVFVLSTVSGSTRRITSTGGLETHVAFSPDGTRLAYVSEREGDMDIYEARLTDPSARTFDAPNAFTEQKLVETAGDAFLPQYSPDGRSLAYFSDRESLVVIDLATGAQRTVLPPGLLYSYLDEDFSFAWSPDSLWLTASAGSPVTHQDVVLVDARGHTPPAYVTRNGYNDLAPRFSADGQAIVWASGREGLRQADTNTGQLDVYAAWLTREGYDAHRLPPAAAPRPTGSISPRLRGIEHRTERLTPFSTNPVFFGLAGDGKSLVLVESASDGQISGRRLSLRGEEPKALFTRPAVPEAMVADASLQHLYVLSQGGVERISLETGESHYFGLSVSFEVNPREEMAYWFQHFWRITKEKFYEPTLHGRDWDGLRARYARYLPHLNTWEDFAEMMSELAGELNASHMGCFYLKVPDDKDETAELGVYWDEHYRGPGYRVASVLPHGPADLSQSLLQPGAVVLAVNDQPIGANESIDALLNHLAGTEVHLKVKPPTGTTPTDQLIVPLTHTQAVDLAYARWVEERREQVLRLSGGRIGYVHIPSMDVDQYKRVYGDVRGTQQDREAMLVDVRYNAGGNLHDQLVTLFTGEVLATFTTRDNRPVGPIPTGRWAKPTALLQNAAAYSDGSIFPHLYKRYGLGVSVGDRVPGTGTAVWWMYVMKSALKWGIPQLGAKDLATGWFENQEIVPDLLVRTDPEAIAAGRDPQLEAAVEALLKRLPSR